MSLTISRRRMLQSAAAGFGYMALRGPAAQAADAKNPLAPKELHHPAKAKRIIFVFMHGGPSQVDTFDYKPRLQQENGKDLPFAPNKLLEKATGRKLMASPWKFAQHGESGAWVSELFP